MLNPANPDDNFDFLTDWKSHFPEAVDKIEQDQRDAVVRRTRFANETPPLSIGVMGQVKAGKSSFLNGLLFGGRALLPEAATPKTANLTRIRHALRPQFTARFYRPDDWALIESQAKGGGQDEASRTARELVDAARASGADIKKLLQQGEITIAADNLEGLMNKLNDYVGSDGRLTSLVAETELALPLDELVGIEIVDTPGMNDPVMSRTLKTRDYMNQCDVVFFLSRASQFLDASDQALMAMQLPQKGVKRLILVGAQFDMAVLDDGFNRPSLEACRARLIDRLSGRAQKIFENLAEQREKQGFPDTADILRCASTPIFASTHAWNIAHQKQDDWMPSVSHTHKEIIDLAKDSWQTTLRVCDWEQLANFKPLTDSLDQARADKEILLAQQRASMESVLATALAEHLHELHGLAEGRLLDLQHNDLASLKKIESTKQAQVDKVSQALSAFLRDTVAQTQERNRQLTEEINQTAARASRLDERTGYERNRHTLKVSDSVWYNPLTWFSSHDENYYETSTYSYLVASDAAENLRYYAQTARHQMLQAFDDLIAPTSLSASLRRELLRAIDTTASDFDPKGLRVLIESSLSSLKLPQLDFDLPDIDGVFSGFTTEIKDRGDIQRLREKFGEIVKEINATLVDRLSTTVKEVSKTLDGIASNLNTTLTARLAEELRHLRENLSDKERQVARLQTLIQTLVNTTGERNLQTNNNGRQ